MGHPIRGDNDCGLHPCDLSTLARMRLSVRPDTDCGPHPCDKITVLSTSDCMRFLTKSARYCRFYPTDIYIYLSPADFMELPTRLKECCGLHPNDTSAELATFDVGLSQTRSGEDSKLQSGNTPSGLTRKRSKRRHVFSTVGISSSNRCSLTRELNNRAYEIDDWVSSSYFTLILKEVKGPSQSTPRIDVGRVHALCVFVVLGLLKVVSGLRTGEHTLYDSLCLTRGQMIPVMWDCKGYVQCMPLGDGKFKAVWIQCSAGRLFDSSKSECVFNYDKCATPKDAAINICSAMPYLKFPHPSSCSLFYDCSQPTARPGLAAWENECPNPLLFDEDTFSCVDRRDTSGPICGSRPERNGRCDPRLGCRSNNCTGLEDGAHFDHSLPFSDKFYVCKNGTVSEKKTCEEDGHIFDPITRECTETITEDSVKAFCTRTPAAIFADPTLCSLLYDCSRQSWNSNLQPFQTECVYPRLFDPNTGSCESFQDVHCGSRQEPVQPCDYRVGHCRGLQCTPCSASCLGLRDGPNAYPGHVLTGFYLVCQQQRTLDERMCAAGYVFDPQMRSCQTEISSQTLDIFCANDPNGRLMHPSECSIYYSCVLSNNTQASPNLPPRAVECRYPYLVDAGTVSCKSHSLVKCGARREPFSPCDYVSNRCVTKDCTRCELVMPSCYGKADNYYPAINQEMTADYIICKDQRVMGSGTCPGGNIFDIRTLTCTDTVYRVSLIEYCTKFRMGRVHNPRNCAQYYDCAISMSDVTECTYPDLFESSSHLCLPYNEVNCSGRPVFLEPCDSFTFCPVQPCPYCNSAYPSCVGRNGAIGGFRFEPSMYYECENDRLKLKYCQTTFNWTVRTCNELISPVPQVQTVSPSTIPDVTTSRIPDTTENIQQTCQNNYRHLDIKSDNCAQFYNCSRQNSPLGDFVDECPIGALFHPATNQCHPYVEVMCQGRYEPKQVCDYQLMCSNRTTTGCAACLEMYPSCINVPNGIIPTKSDFSSSLVHCQSGRVLNVTSCPIGQYYDTLREVCTSVLYNDTVSNFCKDRPNQLIPHPLQCAMYIKCGTPANQAKPNNASFMIGECPYPLQFSNGLCSSYKTTRCGNRKDSVTPCDYEELKKCPDNVNRCRVGTADTCPDNPEHTCIPCEQRFPSCVGQPNGLVDYPGRLFTPDFIQCDDYRTLSILKCVGSVFDPDARRCGLLLDTVVAEAHRRTSAFCIKYPGALIPHPENCARFYNCSAPATPGIEGVPHLEECKYPRLFDSNLRICENFIKVLNTAGCGNKFQPKHYCDYVSMCPSQRFATCAECRRVLPSCQGQENGIHGNPPGSAVARGFMYCVEGRVLTTSPCPLGSLFYESTKVCVSQSTTQRPGLG